MKNMIVSYDKLPRSVKSALSDRFPEGLEQHAFDFRLPNKNEVYRAVRLCLNEINYLIKLERKRLDRPDVLDTI